MEVPLYPSLPSGALSVEVLYRTDVAQFDTTYQVRSGRWARSRLRFTMAYEWLLPAEWQSILDIYHRQLGGLREFRFDDYSDTAPRARVFGVGDGTSLVFWLQHDYTSAAVVYVDGAPYADAYVDSQSGRVQFDVAPARGQVLTYDADDAGYRVRFASDVLPYERLHWGGFSQTVEIEQVSDLQDIYPIRQVVCGGAIDSYALDATNDAVAFSFVCPCDVLADDVSYYVFSLLNPGTARVSICDDYNGLPGTVLEYGDSVPAGVGWETVALGGPIALEQGTRYWVTVAAESGTWDATHKCSIQYTSGVPNPIPGEDQDDILWGGYNLFDRRCQNTPHSWLGVSTSAAGAAWTLRDPTAHPAFYINQVPQIVGHCQGPLTEDVYALVHTRENFPIETTHDMIIDRIGGVFSTAGAPADSLEYAIVFASAPGVVLRTGVISTPIDTDGEPTYMEAALWTPLTVPTGDTMWIVFYSTLSLVGAPWTHWGHTDQWIHYAVNWVPNWNSVRWAEDASRAEVSIDGGLTYPTSMMGAWTVRCRGVMVP